MRILYRRSENEKCHSGQQAAASKLKMSGSGKVANRNTSNKIFFSIKCVTEGWYQMPVPSQILVQIPINTLKSHFQCLRTDARNEVNTLFQSP